MLEKKLLLKDVKTFYLFQERKELLEIKTVQVEKEFIASPTEDLVFSFQKK